jgi:hypothetical protein
MEEEEEEQKSNLIMPIKFIFSYLCSSIHLDGGQRQGTAN